MSDHTTGPRALAEKARASIAELEQLITEPPTQQQKKRLRQSLSLQRDVLAWLEFRAGY